LLIDGWIGIFTTGLTVARLNSLGHVGFAQQWSFDHLVGRGERHGDAERFRRLEVYDEEIVRINVAELI
jgi:hypothetical protein